MWRLVFSFLGLSLLTVTFVSTAAYFKARDALRESMFDRLTAVAVVMEGEINRWMDRQRNGLENLATLPGGAASLTALTQDYDRAVVAEARAELQRFVDAAKRGLPDLEELFVLSRVGGEVLASTNPSQVGEYRATDLFLLEGLEGTFIQHVYPSPITGRPTLTVAAPLRNDGGRAVAVLAGHVSLERMDRILAERTGLGETGEAYLVSGFNEFVNSKRFGRSDYPRGAHSVGIDRALSGSSDTGAYTNYAGSPVLGAFRWNPEREMALVVEMGRREALAPARALVRTIVGIGLASVLLLTVGVLLISRRVARPISALTLAATRVADGDFSATAPVLSEDEVGVLARSFNEMTARLNRLYDDLKHRSTAVERANSALQSKNDEIQRMYHTLCHELKTPLTSVREFAALVRDGLAGPVNDEQSEYLDEALAGCDDLTRHVNDLVDMTRLETGKLTCVRQEADLVELLKKTVAAKLNDAHERKVQVRVDAPDRLPSVHVDAMRIGQVVANLLENALKFTPEGGEVSIEASPQFDASEWIRVSVTDTGRGLEPEHVDRIFDRLYQVSEHDWSTAGGLGLGLHLCREIVKLHGGRIWVQSVPGEGAMFSFTVPVHVAARTA